VASQEEVVMEASPVVVNTTMANLEEEEVANQEANQEASTTATRAILTRVIPRTTPQIIQCTTRPTRTQATIRREAATPKTIAITSYQKFPIPRRSLLPEVLPKGQRGDLRRE